MCKYNCIVQIYVIVKLFVDSKKSECLYFLTYIQLDFYKIFGDSIELQTILVNV